MAKKVQYKKILSELKWQIDMKKRERIKKIIMNKKLRIS